MMKALNDQDRYIGSQGGVWGDFGMAILTPEGGANLARTLTTTLGGIGTKAFQGKG